MSWSQGLGRQRCVTPGTMRLHLLGSQTQLTAGSMLVAGERCLSCARRELMMDNETAALDFLLSLEVIDLDERLERRALDECCDTAMRSLEIEGYERSLSAARRRRRRHSNKSL